MAKQKKILLGVTGSIAAYKSADLIRRLSENGLKVSVIMTKDAEHFITPLTLSSLAGEEVYRAHIDERESWRMPHIKLAQEADLVLIAPATANIIGKLASGIADDLLTCTVLATKAKVLIAPAMNTEMYHHKVVQENCSKLKKFGIKFIEPVKGKLACGTTGDGHIADEKTIIKTVLTAI
ncbi:MAG: hypothetical protein KC618_00990 [Candidatus Omnitrophica bacterium]|nr:hypothetical protein [Candidatus Omnitrophota bacterium]